MHIKPRGGARPGAGRPPDSTTGEPRKAWNIAIAPAARAAIEAAAAAAGVSPSAMIERWGLRLGEE